jgi:hypothetical protein
VIAENIRPPRWAAFSFCRAAYVGCWHTTHPPSLGRAGSAFRAFPLSAAPDIEGSPAGAGLVFTREHYGQHPGGLLWVARMFRARRRSRCCNSRSSKQNMSAFDAETPEVVFVVGIIVSIELIERSDALEYLGSAQRGLVTPPARQPDRHDTWRGCRPLRSHGPAHPARRPRPLRSRPPTDDRALISGRKYTQSFPSRIEHSPRAHALPACGASRR